MRASSPNRAGTAISRRWAASTRISSRAPEPRTRRSFMRIECRLLLVAGVVAALAVVHGDPELTLPNQPASVKFAALGDNGTGEPPEYETADQMAAWHARFPFEFVLMLGD